jgi:hypothetical protein
MPHQIPRSTTLFVHMELIWNDYKAFFTLMWGNALR